MQRAFDLALLGSGRVSPNPLVGSVVVYEGRIIGEGHHRQYGQAHAEVNAINSVADKALLKESTLYVNLEPCSHFGKTPPCADLIIHHRLKRVVISNVDTNPLVGGKGVQKLREAGVDVLTGVMESEGRFLNRRFFTFIERKRPYIILKWAETADGFIARKNYDSKWISNESSRQLVHRWRSEEDAILVGTKTAQHDNPQLNVRDWTGRDPVRIVIDRFLKLDPRLKLFDGSQKTLCYNLLKDDSKSNVTFIRVAEARMLDDILQDLHAKNVQSVIIEGGRETLEKFFEANLWDEARIFMAPAVFSDGIPAPRKRGKTLSELKVGNDVLLIMQPS